MKYITSYYKRLKLRNIKIAVLAVFVSIFLLPSFVPFEKTGNNIFTVILNGREVGVVSKPEDAQDCILEARRQIAMQSEELVLVESNLETQGKEVLWGKVDEADKIIGQMVEVLTADVRETLHRSYVVKINEYMVNLSSESDVVGLLQAALDKYDSEGNYQVELQFDSSRELPVLTTHIMTQEEVVEEAQELERRKGRVHRDR